MDQNPYQSTLWGYDESGQAAIDEDSELLPWIITAAAFAIALVVATVVILARRF
jgi:hypothetical protein